MTGTESTQGFEGTPQNSGVINPYALAELIAGRRIDWSAVSDRAGMLEDILQTPYAELFDPVHEGPLYTGLRLDQDLALQRVRSPLLDVTVDLDRYDIDLPYDGDGDVRMLRDLGPRFDTSDVGTIPVVRSETTAGGRMLLTLRLPDKHRLERLHTVLTPDVVRSISFDTELKVTDGWTPPGGTWARTGDFFKRAPSSSTPFRAPSRTATTSQRCRR